MKKSGPTLRDLEYISRKIVDKKIIKKINSVDDSNEKIILHEYSIKVAMELLYAQLKQRLEEIERRGNDSFIQRTKVHLLGSRIHFFYVSMNKKDFKEIMKTFKQINKELK